MKILLINPPTDYMIKSELPEWVNKITGVFPPLGLMYIASYLRLHTGYQVKILDTIAEDISYNEIEQYIKSYQPKLVGISAYTHNLIDVILVAKTAKKILPDVHVCLGGAHANLFPEQAIKIPEVDSVVLGEGESTFAELATALDNNSNFHKIKGLIFKQNEEIISTGRRENITDLDALPFPDRSLIRGNKYYHVSGRNSKMTTMLSSRGCPYQCSFCSTTHGAYRTRSPQDIVKEMAECASLGFQDIHFVDDAFNVSQERVACICDEILKMNLKVRWSFRGRVDNLSKALFKKAKEAGCVRINLGVETSTNEGLKILNKQIDVGQIKEAFKRAREVGIATVAYFMIGCPHERTKADVLKTIDFACELDPDFALFNILTLYPETLLYKNALGKGIIKQGNWDVFVSEPHLKFEPPIWGEHLNREDLAQLLKFSYKKFYLRPKVFLRNLLNLTDLSTLKRKLKTCLNILRE